METKACANCKYVSGLFEDIDVHTEKKTGRWFGKCRRFPPIYNGDDMKSCYVPSAQWSIPVVESDHWCGEWRSAAE